MLIQFEWAFGRFIALCMLRQPHHVTFENGEQNLFGACEVLEQHLTLVHNVYSKPIDIWLDVNCYYVYIGKKKGQQKTDSGDPKRKRGSTVFFYPARA